MAELALRVYLPERPKHHNFKFMTRVAREINPNQRAQTLDEYNLRKESIASAIDDDRINFIEMTIKGLHKDFDYFEAEFPNSSILVNKAIFEDLDMQLDRLIAMLEQFKRQHEGFIELNEVALEFRAQREDAMHEQLDSFWRLLNFVNGEIQKKYNTGMRGGF
ncbi:uncharacterized protein F4807DRAFT_404995 [Annulohypoxylon truncatum]|uniref:uncharacterized protein n=1 Tax=Annulohypoxylon truncatum TaxID=327061 RepID=UPI0020077973|nr:uncharacterized protein F4807DRAFT_404995 [Annulohypoxylon truncatum]KAI1214901.1 hypothetical protein F4807DRAFT_404995 [Annulohypoxylon truncatum]